MAPMKIKLPVCRNGHTNYAGTQTLWSNQKVQLGYDYLWKYNFINLLMAV